MKTSRRFLGLALIVFITVGLVSYPFGDRLGDVEEFRGAELKASVFYPLIAGNVNSQGLLGLRIDGKPEAADAGGLFLDGGMNVLSSLSFIRNVFSASAANYKDGRVRIDRNYTTVNLTLGSKKGMKDGDEIELKEEPAVYNGQCYISLSDAATLFGYGYSFDRESMTVSLDSTTAEKPMLRKSFDLRKLGRVSKIRDQGSLSACWAFAAVSALESSRLPDDDTRFSADNLANHNTYGITDKDAGSYMTAVSTMLSWRGPVKKNESEPACHLQEVHFYNNDDIDAVKWAVFKNGGVSTSLYADIDSSDLSGSGLYNPANNSYYYNGSNAPNHDVVIIGWDDNFPARYFGKKAPGNGAFICQNSWGDDFGDKGVFYVSYYDTNIANNAVSYVKSENTDNYDRIYQTDMLGEVGQIGFGNDTVMAANVYTAKTDENLSAVGFYTIGKNTEYKVYTVSDFTDTGSFGDRVLKAEGTLSDIGYYTIPIKEPMELRPNENFAVVVYLKTPGSKQPMAIEGRMTDASKKAIITDGTGYISPDGISWTRSETDYNANLCLKAYSVIRQTDSKGDVR
jgi:C1A family cysteine protease